MNDDPSAIQPGRAQSAPLSLARFSVPWGGQQVELLPIAFEGGGPGLLRVRIREAKRFTIFDIDAATAAAWGEAMVQWARAQPGFEPSSATRPSDG